MPRSVLAAGVPDAACVDVDGWTVAATYDDPAREYDALRDGAAVVDLAFRARVRVTGGERIDFLQGMLTNDVRRLQEGDGVPSLLLTEQGRIVADCVVLALADAVLLDARAVAAARATEALARYIVADDVELAPDETTHAIGVLGPRAGAVLAALGVAAPPAAAYAHALYETEVGPVRAVRVPTPGPGGFVCLVPRAAAEAWWTVCTGAGAIPAGFAALDTLRIESGIPASGVDVGPETIALEAPFEAAISFGKGCYLGQEVVERVTARGHVNRKLVSLVIDGRDVPRIGDTLFAADKDVGRITSAAWSWRLDRPVALGYVRREHVAPGTTLAVHGEAGALTATVHAIPVG